MKQYSPSCERNQEPILKILVEILPESGTVLEVGSGTGQHVARFGQALPGLKWQPSDLESSHPSIRAWCAEIGLTNVLSPVVVDLSSPGWPAPEFDALVCINTIHIVAWPLVVNLFRGAGRVLKKGGVMFVYGPYEYRDRPLEPTNVEFHEWLKMRNPQSGIRMFDEVNELARENGLVLEGDEAMPANNRSIWWRKSQD
jgi:SAM-dependent methyltransferase